ncbi:MAG TPA: PilZ domain-containing protein [Terriglobales bacterium]|nr:PilZ domain-containing protein [Terriglobales bacterium]
MQIDTPPASKSHSTDRVVQRHPRTLLSVPITLHYLSVGGVRASHGISLDISESGIGALVDPVLPVGDTVAINLELPERELNTVAIVRHSSSVRSGFEFVGLTVEERSGILNIAKQANRGGRSPPFLSLTG